MRNVKVCSRGSDTKAYASYIYEIFSIHDGWKGNGGLKFINLGVLGFAYNSEKRLSAFKYTHTH